MAGEKATLQRQALVAQALLTAAAAAYLALGFADAGPVLLCLALLALAGGMLGVVSIRRVEYGAAVAWMICALPFVFLATLLALHLVRPGIVFGLTQCDVMAQSCGPAPAYLWLPLALFLACDLVWLRVIRGCKVAEGA